jgi:hypothetical protein
MKKGRGVCVALRVLLQVQKGKKQGGVCGVTSVVVNIVGSAKRAKECVEKGEVASHTTTFFAGAITTKQFQFC